MKKIKRTLAVFMSAIMIMAMLAGCGGGTSNSTADKFRSATGAKQKAALDNIAYTIARGSYDENTVKSAFAENGYSVTSDWSFNGEGYSFNFRNVSSSNYLTYGHIYITKTYATEESWMLEASVLKPYWESQKTSLAENAKNDGLSNVQANVYVALAETGTGEWIYITEYSATGIL